MSKRKPKLTLKFTHHAGIPKRARSRFEKTITARLAAKGVK